MKKFFRTTYLAVMAFLLGAMPCFLAYAEAVAEEATQKGDGFYALAAGLAIAIAAFGGALGQGRVGASAMEGIARNPQSQKIMFIPMIIVLALIESFVIFSFAIAMIIAGKI